MRTKRLFLLAGGVFVAVAVAALSHRFLTSGRQAVPSAAQPIDEVHSAEPALEIGQAVQETPSSAEDESSSGAVEELRVVFPSGGVVLVQMKEVPPSMPLPENLYPRPLAQQYAMLRSMAEAGDGVAARVLYRELKYCRRAYSSSESLRVATGRLHKERVIVLPESSGRPPIKIEPNESLADAETVWLKEPFEHCKGTTQEQIAEARRWAETAAAANDYQGLQEYALALGDTSEGFQAWERIWEMGYKTALVPLARLYIRGVPPITAGQADYVHGYAYRMIGYKLLEAAYQGSTSRNDLQRLEALQKNLAYTAGFMSPEQIEEATVLAEKLLSNNSNCCAGGW